MDKNKALKLCEQPRAWDRRWMLLAAPRPYRVRIEFQHLMVEGKVVNRLLLKKVAEEDNSQAPKRTVRLPRTISRVAVYLHTTLDQVKCPRSDHR